MKKASITKALLLCVILCGFSSSVWAKSKTLKLGSVAMDYTLRPETAIHYMHLLVIPLYSQKLISVDSRGVVRAELAKKWSISPDQRTYTFYLRDDITFHDGTPMNAHHVMDSFLRVMKELRGDYTFELLQELIEGGELTKQNKSPTGFKVINDYEFQIVLNKPFAFFLDFISTNRFGVFKRVSNQVNPIGSGPYVPHVDKQNDVIRFKRFENFKGQRPYWDEVDVYHIKDVKNVSAMIQNKGVQVFLGLAVEDMMKKFFPSNFQYYKYPRFGYFHMFFNFKNKVLQDEALRKSLSSLIRGAAQKVKDPGLFLSHQTTFVSPGILYRSYYSQNRPVITAQEFKAKYPKVSFEKPLEIYFRQDYVYKSITDSIQSTLNEAGIPATVHRKSYSDVINAMTSGQFDMALYGQYGFDSDPEAFLIAIMKSFGDDSYILENGFIPKETESFKYMANSKEKLKKYSDFFQSLEQKELMLPLFRLYYPIVHQKGLVIPSKGFNLDLKPYEIMPENL